MNKKILAVSLLAVAAISVFFLIKSAENTPSPMPNTATSTVDITGPQLPLKPLSTEENALREASWEVFSTYLKSAKAHDLEKVKSLSYRLSPTCTDPKKKSECNKLMDDAAYFGSFIPHDWVKHVAYDDKQMILFSDYIESKHDISIGYQRSIIYFIRTSDGIKLLSFNPADGFILATDGKATTTQETRFGELIKDADGDTLANVFETCNTDIVQFCQESNPYKKDTNGNGFWDSIDAILSGR